MRSAIKTTALLVASAATLGACDYTGDWLFAGFVEGIPGVYHIYAEDGGQYLTPIPRDSSADEIEAATMYLEIGPEPGAALGGVTFNFLGTGGPVCVFVDPETAAWNNSVAAEQDEVQRAWSYPDNPFDDGDLDVFVGLSAYYNGSPGVAMGDFRVTYSDSLGNEVPIELSECSNTNVFDDPGRFFSGRGMPLDPSSSEEDRYASSKLVIDATRQWPEEGGPRDYPELNRTLLEELAPDAFDIVMENWGDVIEGWGKTRY